MCLDVGILQAYLDQELDAPQRGEVEICLSACEECRRLLEELKNNNDFVVTRLETYVSEVESFGIETNMAWARFYGDLPAKEKKFKLREVFQFMKRYRLAAAAAMMTLVLAASLSFSSVRSFAGELLTVFRVHNVQTININPQEIDRMRDAIEKGTGKVDIDNFGKIEFSGKNTVDKVSLEQARQSVDFSIKLPSQLVGDFSDPVIQKSSGGTASFTLDVDNANSLLSSLGSQKLLPKELDNKTFTLIMPAGIGAEYKAKNGAASLFVGQSRSPEMSVPEGAPVNEIRDALLSVPVLPDSLKQQLASVNDWQHTVLIPNINGSSQEVMVNGVQGVFATEPEQYIENGGNASERHMQGKALHGGSGKGSALIWQNDGVIYTIAGNELTLEQSLGIASSMK